MMRAKLQIFSVSRIKTLLHQWILLCIKAYQRWISPMLGPRCRFYPSCSQYTIEALTEYGLLKGLKMGCVRVLKCHPFHSGGADPVLKNNQNLDREL